MDIAGTLPEDHPGFADAHYRRRRGEIAAASGAWAPGEPLPRIDYAEVEHDVWRTVARELAPLHRRYASSTFLEGVDRLALPGDHIPQLADVSERLGRLSGFGVEPVPGLVPTRQFYGSLGRSSFLSTQYLRHGSTPLYTPEPDVIHEVIGHCNLLATPLFADLHRRAGRCADRCETDDALEFFSRVFWFTLEFGVVIEDGEPHAYGAGLVSSFGEIQAFRDAEIRPFDIVEMGTRTYDITHYQPVLFSVTSVDELHHRLGSFLDDFDDAHHRRLTGRSDAA